MIMLSDHLEKVVQNPPNYQPADTVILHTILGVTQASNPA